jgi:hypothetical protein
MSPPARPSKLSFRIRRNFVSRDWTSIGLRGVRATFRRANNRKTATLPGSVRSNESRIVGFDAQASNPPLTSGAPSAKDWSEWLWLGLIMLASAATATVQVMQ